MSSNDRHADAATHAQPATITEKAPAAVVPGVSIDNGARAAEVERERVFAAGDDTEPGAQPPAAEARSLIVEAAARIRAADRPSPFGVAQFPPLPVPPLMLEQGRGGGDTDEPG